MSDPTTTSGLEVLSHGVAGVLLFVSCVLGRHVLKKEEELKSKDKEREVLWEERHKDLDAHAKKVEEILTRQVEKDEKSATLLAEVRDAMNRVAALEKHFGGE